MQHATKKPFVNAEIKEKNLRGKWQWKCNHKKLLGCNKINS